MISGKSKTSNGDLRVVVHRPGVALMWRVLLVIVCFAIWGVGFLVGGWEERRVPTKLLYEEREHLLAKIVEYRNRIGDLEIELAQRDVELDIARASSEKVRDDYRNMYERLDQLQAEVVHYQRVLKPNTGDQGIVMGMLRLDLARNLNESQEKRRLINFSLDFFQTVDRLKLTGDVEMILKGRQGGETKTWNFKDLSAQDPLQLNLGFRHYQTLGGVIELPVGVEPLEVAVNAKITRGKTVSLSKVFAWTLKELSDDLEQGEALN